MNCHNGEKYLKDALDSVFIQSYTNWELIFWDNISNDNTEKIVFSYKDSRVRYFKSKIFSSLPIARNNALCRANGEFICFLDVDDYWEADKIERQLNGFINSKIGVVSTYFYVLNERSNIYKTKIVKQTKITLNSLLCHYSLHFSSLMIRKEAIDKFSYYFNPNYEIIQDFDLIIRIAYYYDINVIKCPLAYYRWHGSNFGNSNFSKLINEKEKWVENNIQLKSYKGFGYLKKSINWYKAVYLMRSGNKFQSFIYFDKLSFINSLKFLIYIMLPQNILRKN